MAAYNKFNLGAESLSMDTITTDAYKWVFTNTAPVATNALYSDVSGTELAAGNGYTTGGLAAGTVTKSNTSGVEKVIFPTTTLTATGPVGPFRYAILVNTTLTTPLKPLIMWFDYGSSVTMANTETFVITPDATNGHFTLT